MKQNVSPGVAVAVIVIVLAVIALWYYRGSAGSSRRAAEIEKTIQAGLAGGPPPGVTASGPSGPHGQTGGPPPGIGPRAGSGGPPIQTGIPMGPSPGAPGTPAMPAAPPGPAPR